MAEAFFAKLQASFFQKSCHTAPTNTTNEVFEIGAPSELGMADPYGGAEAADIQEAMRRSTDRVYAENCLNTGASSGIDRAVPEDTAPMEQDSGAAKRTNEAFASPKSPRGKGTIRLTPSSPLPTNRPRSASLGVPAKRINGKTFQELPSIPFGTYTETERALQAIAMTPTG
jgi:hypothetical protein